MLLSTNSNVRERPRVAQNSTSVDRGLYALDKDLFTQPAPSLSSKLYSESVYPNYNPAFSHSNVSTQDSLMTQQTKSTTQTSLESIADEVESLKSNLRKKRTHLEHEIMDAVHSPDFPIPHSEREAISNSIKIGRHYNNKNSDNFSLHIAQKTVLKPVPKNNIVLINNLPYPVQLQFPAKISKRNCKRDNVYSGNSENRSLFNSVSTNQSLNIPNMPPNINPPARQCNAYNKNMYIQVQERSGENNSPKRDSTYDTILNVIDSYIDEPL